MQEVQVLCGVKAITLCQQPFLDQQLFNVLVTRLVQLYLAGFLINTVMAIDFFLGLFSGVATLEQRDKRINGGIKT